MVRRYNRLFAALHVAADAASGIVAFLLAYWVRFHSGLIAVTKGYPPFEQYLWLAPIIGGALGGIAYRTLIADNEAPVVGDA